MSVKLCFGNEIHRVSKLPVTISALKETIQKVFDGKLPEQYNLQYFDTDGDNIMLINDEDYSAMLDEFSPSKKAIKIYIRGLDSVCTSVLNTNKDESTIEISNQVDESNFFYIENKEEEAPKDESKPSTQESVEKETPVDPDVQKKSQDDSQEGEPEKKNKKKSSPESLNFCDIKIKVKRLSKKLASSQYNDEEKKCFEFKLNKLRSKLSEKDQEKFDNKKEKCFEKCQKKGEKIKGFFMSLMKQSASEIFQKAKQTDEEGSEQHQGGPHHFCHHGPHGPQGFGMRPLVIQLIDNFSKLDEDNKKLVNNLLGNIPEQMVQKFESRKKCIAERKEMREKKMKEKLEQVEEDKEEEPKQDKTNEQEVKPQGPPFIQKMMKHLTKHHKKPKCKAAPAKKCKLEEVAEKIENPVAPQFDIQLIKEVSTIPSNPSTKDLVIYKTVCIKNTGTQNWPMTVFLTNVSKEKSINAQDSKLISIAPGKEMSAVLIIDSPQKAGSFTTSWSLATKDEKGETNLLGEPFQLSFSMTQAEAPKPKTVKVEYPQDVVKKVDQLKSIFADADKEALLQFVSQHRELTIEELIDNYLNL